MDPQRDGHPPTEDKLWEVESTVAVSGPVPYWEVADGAAVLAHKPMIRETPWTLLVNGQHWLTLLCTPTDLRAFVLGFLFNEGIIERLADVSSLEIVEAPEAQIVVELTRRDISLPQHRTLTTGCGGGITFFDLAAQREPIRSERRVTPEQISTLMETLIASVAREHRTVGGFHTSGLSHGEGFAVIASDIGRHNTLDKIAGACLLRGEPTHDAILLTTGRVSTEMLGKAARMRIPVVATANSPTHLARELAHAWQITLIGYVRGARMHIYTGWERVVGLPTANRTPTDA